MYIVLKEYIITLKRKYGWRKRKSRILSDKYRWNKALLKNKQKSLMSKKHKNVYMIITYI